MWLLLFTQHEDASVDMFDHMMTENKLGQSFEFSPKKNPGSAPAYTQLLLNYTTVDNNIIGLARE